MTSVGHGHAPSRLLGIYLFCLCVYQIGIYQWPGGTPFILDPRAGISILLINLFSFDNKVIAPMHWITTLWLFFLAAMILLRGRFLKVYLISECLLAAPTAYYLGTLAVRHGGDFAPGFKDLALTGWLLLIFSVVPIGFALWCIRRRAAG